MSVAGGEVYLAWQPRLRPGGVVARTELARIDAATGTMVARQRLGAAIGQVVAAKGWLWVAAVSGGERLLEKLNPSTLAVTGRWRVGADRWGAWEGNVLAVAGGGLWDTVGGRLVRFSLPQARVTATVVLPRAATSDVASDAAGSALLVGEADQNGLGAVQRREPVTGALLASHPVEGVAAPIVAGLAGSGVWFSEPTGMMGYVQRLDATTLRPGGGSCWLGKSSPACVQGSNGITVRLANGLVWVTQLAGGSGRNFCADPATGQVLASLPLPNLDQDYVLAIGPRSIFYAAPGKGAADYVREAPAPAACKAR